MQDRRSGDRGPIAGRVRLFSYPRCSDRLCEPHCTLGNWDGEAGVSGWPRSYFHPWGGDILNL